MSLAELGIEGYGELVGRMAAVGDRIREGLRETGWLVTNETPLPVICFTRPEIRERRYTTRDVLDVIYERGHVWISDVALGGERVLRACVTSFRSGEEDIQCLLDELEEAVRLARCRTE